MPQYQEWHQQRNKLAGGCPATGHNVMPAPGVFHGQGFLLSDASPLDLMLDPCPLQAACLHSSDTQPPHGSSSSISVIPLKAFPRLQGTAIVPFTTPFPGLGDFLPLALRWHLYSKRIGSSREWGVSAVPVSFYAIFFLCESTEL